MTDEQLLTQFWRRAVTGIVGLGRVGLGLFLLYVGIRPECENSNDGLCVGIAQLLLLANPILALLGTPVVLAAVRRPGSIPPLVVAVCITLVFGVPPSISAFVVAAASDYALAALVSFVALGGVFTVAYLIAPREVSK